MRVLLGRDANESAELAERALAEGCESLVVVGGDGIVHLGLQAVVAAGATLGIVPTGTGNDLARSLGIPERNPSAAADVVVACACRVIDLGLAGGRYFGTVLAAGFDSRVSERASNMRWPFGQMRYNLAAAAELRVFEPIHFAVQLDGVSSELDAMLVAVGNTASYGGGLRMCEGAQVDDGWLDVVVIKPISKPELIKVYPRLLRGTHVTHPSYQRHRVQTVSLTASEVVAYADGERLAPLPLTVEVAAQALRVHAPSEPRPEW